MKNVDWKDVCIRSAKTFLEVFLSWLATVLGGVTYGDGSLTSAFTVGALLTAAATAATAVLNGVILPLLKQSDR